VDRAEVLNKQINDYAYALSNMLIELHDEYGIDRRREILEYLQEKLKLKSEKSENIRCPKCNSIQVYGWKGGELICIRCGYRWWDKEG